MELDVKTKQIVRELGEALNRAIEKSSAVADAIRRLREAGYELQLTIKMEIGLRELEETETQEQITPEELNLDLTDEDLRTLRRMKIKLE